MWTTGCWTSSSSSHPTTLDRMKVRVNSILLYKFSCTLGSCNGWCPWPAPLLGNY
jgi:hypothetical protein